MAASKKTTKKATSRISKPAAAAAVRSRKQPTGAKSQKSKGTLPLLVGEVPTSPLRTVLLFVLFLALTVLLIQLYYS